MKYTNTRAGRSKKRKFCGKKYTYEDEISRRSPSTEKISKMIQILK